MIIFLSINVIVRFSANFIRSPYLVTSHLSASSTSNTLIGFEASFETELEPTSAKFPPLKFFIKIVLLSASAFTIFQAHGYLWT